MAQDPKRLQLHEILVDILGSEAVYFQPPATVQMQYPCIVYRRDRRRTEFANNSPYRHTKLYQVIHIGRDPDSPVPDKIAELPLTLFDRFYTADNLNHDVYNVYF